MVYDNLYYDKFVSMAKLAPSYNFQEYFDHVRKLWRDGGVRECFRRSNEYQLIDSAE